MARTDGRVGVRHGTKITWLPYVKVVPVPEIPELTFVLLECGLSVTTYNVVETSCGMSLSVATHTQKETIQKLRECVQKYGVDKIRALVASSIEEYGAIPLEEGGSER